VDPRACLDDIESAISLPHRNSNTDPSVVLPVTIPTALSWLLIIIIIIIPCSSIGSRADFFSSLPHPKQLLINGLFTERNIVLASFFSLDRSVAQGVTTKLLTTETRLQFQGSSYGIRVGQNGIGIRFCPTNLLSHSHVSFYPMLSSLIYFPLAVAVAMGLSLTQTKE
jgi:hypothetical protein